MALSFCVLGSGSGGNSTLIISGKGQDQKYTLLDCGLSPRQTNKRMAALGVTVADISAILLTHLDSDHFYPGWVKPIQQFNIPLHVHRRHRAAAWRTGLTARHAALFEDCVELECGIAAKTHLLSHDALGSVGYVLEHDGLRLGYATDLGRVPDSLIDVFAEDGGLNALALESNYDPEMQISSDRPVYLKRRIMGGSGHLSNEQCLEAVSEIVHRCVQADLSHIALLHLSRQCNCPKLLHKLYATQAPHLMPRLTITNQFLPSPLLEVKKLHKTASPGTANRVGRTAPVVRSHRQLPLFTGGR